MKIDTLLNITIPKLCEKVDDFQTRLDELDNELRPWTIQKLDYHLGNAGIIPERYRHDSAEEKLYAKFCDLLVAEFLKKTGIKSELIQKRSDRADVIGFTDQYKIVADAKAFRLSRTALNVKDYKIGALNGWREKDDANYACLVGPIHEFPKRKSRLFDDAINYNVTLLSYSHLQLLLKADELNPKIIEDLWIVGTNLLGQEATAQKYWGKINSVLNEIVNLEDVEKELQNISCENSYNRARKEIEYLEKIKEDVAKLDKKQLVKKLMTSMKINNKIGKIREKLDNFKFDNEQTKL